MSLKPIDLQTNISQMHEVGRHEHSRNTSVILQQQALDEESTKKTREFKDRLDEAKKAEKTEVRDSLADDREREKARREKERKEREASEESEKMKDDRLGRIIDILK